jgi:hypothetical protein
MNQRIKELMKEAGTDVSGKWMNIDNVEKYTELLIKECSGVLLKWKNEPFPFDEDVAASLIKEHFDIKS